MSHNKQKVTELARAISKQQEQGGCRFFQEKLEPILSLDNFSVARGAKFKGAACPSRHFEKHYKYFYFPFNCLCLCSCFVFWDHICHAGL